jgi:hypothetical protein
MTKQTTGVIIFLCSLAAITLTAIADDTIKPDIDFKGSRFAVGYLDSGANGSYPDGSFQMPDVKLRFNWKMTPDITISTRMNLNNATFNSLDVFYLDYKNLLPLAIPSMKDGVFNPILRIGRLKVDFGEEQLSNDPINGVLISNSASNVAGYDEGLQLYQNIPKETLGIPAKWAFSITNGNSGSGADNEQAKAIAFKVGVNPIPELYVSGSYYNTGDLGKQSADLSYSGLVTITGNATEWTRSITEIDLRYDIQPGKENRLNPGSPAWSDSKAYIRVAYGQFKDSGKDRLTPVVKITPLEGTYYFLEGCYNATDKLYIASRYSLIEFDKNTTFASLNGVNANNYARISAGVGYRLTDNTHFKVEYMANGEDIPTGATKAKNDQIALLFTTLF